MAQKVMYPPQKDSPSTFLLGDISAVDTLMTVASAAALPQTLPYPLTLGIDKTLTETVMVTAQNLGNNQLTVTRGTPAYAWVAGSEAARVLRATDFLDVQDNIRDVDTRLTTTQGTVATHDTDILELETAVGDTDSGLVKGLADEITRATAAEGAEATRATAAEGNLDAIKVNRSELAQVITDWVYSADGTKVLVTITRYNASTQQTTQYTRTLPVVSDEDMGVMTPEAYAEITALRNDVNSLINLGGRFIGVSFATKAALDAYVVPASIKTGDFTYVIDDETKSGATTRYVRNEGVWGFTFTIEHDPVGIANASTAGIVKSDSGSTDGKVFVEVDGTMSVVGWDALNLNVNGKVPATRTINTKALSADISLNAADVGAVPTARTVNTKALSADISLNAADVGAVPTARTVNTKALSADISLSAADVGAVPTARTVNTKALSADISLSAADVGAVAKTGNETIAGVKTFSSFSVTPSSAPTTNYQVANKKYVDDNAGGGVKVARFVVGASTAGWTATDCDYLCDGTADQTEINAAITALPATGGEVIILDGTYNITSTIDVTKDNVSIRGNGNATILKRMYNSASSEGLITLTSRSGCKIANLQVYGNKTSYASVHNTGIYLNASSNNTVTGNTCNNNNYGIYLNASSSNNTVTGNTCNNNDTGIYLYASSNNNNTVTGNTCNNNGTGIYLYASSNNNNNNTVTGNTCSNNNYDGIYLNASSNNTVTGNTCNNNNNTGIDLNFSSSNTVTGNTCNNNDTGIYLYASSNNTVTGNTCIRGTGQAGDYTTAQNTIQLTGTSNNYNLISNNNCMGKAVTNGGGTGNTLVNNKFDAT